MSRKCIIVVMMLTVATFMYADLAKAQYITDGLIAYWSLDKSAIDGKTVKDLIGKNDGTMNANIKVVPGKIGDALEFNGTSDKVDIPGDDVLDFNGKSAFTVTAWINVKGPSGGACCGTIVGQRDANGWALRYDNRPKGKEIELIVCPNWAGDGAYGIPVPKVGEWHHIAAVLTGKELLMYLDGVLGDTGKFAFAAGKVLTTSMATTIGGASDGNFNGTIDEAMIYNRALTDKEIAQNFQAKGMAVDSKSKLAVRWGELKR